MQRTEFGRRGNFAILAYEQVRGRGQYDRTWESERGGMYLSIPFRNCLPNTMELGKIVKGYLEELTDRVLTLKPPNDILLDEKKLCGILVEAKTREKETYGVIGIGLNVYNKPKNRSNLEKFTTLSINSIAKEIVCKVCQYLGQQAQ